MRSLRILLPLLIATRLITSATAATFNIPDGDVAALKNAITTANSNGQADVINLASNGSYKLTVVDNAIAGPTGLPPINNDAAGVDLTINGNGAVIYRSYDTGTPEFRILHVNAGAGLNGDRLQIENGALSGSTSPASRGAAILVSQGSLSLTNSLFRYHSAYFGGAISASAGALNLAGCTFRDNFAKQGGAVFGEGTSIEVRSSSFEQNVGVIDTNSTSSGNGAAIMAGLGTLIVSDSAFTGNVGVGSGGAIYTIGTATITNCDFAFNAADHFGGAVRSDAQLTLVNSRMVSNGAGLGGGAVFNRDTATVQRCTFDDNSAGPVGGGICNTGTLTVESSTLNGNSVVIANAADGGGIGTFKFSGPVKTTVRNSTLSNNSARRGGGIANVGTLELLNSTLSGNSASSTGGGVFNLDGDCELTALTFANNSAPTGGGIYNVKNTGAAQVFIASSILKAGAAGANLVNVNNGDFRSFGYNLSSDAADGNASSAPGGLLSQPSDIRNTDPNLGPLQDNGGLTKTHAILFPSAAIDSGDSFRFQPPTPIVNDQRGAGFPRVIGAGVDMGAFESGRLAVVTTTSSHNDGVCSANDCTLPEAIAAANSAGSGTVLFAPGVTGTIELAGPLPDLTRNLSVQGPGAGLLTIRRNTGGDYRIFTISNGTSKGPRVNLADITIANGRAPGGSSPNDSGGGILNDRGQLDIERCVITGNSSAPGSTFGGGILNRDGDLWITESTVAANTARYGGGIAHLINDGLHVLSLYQSTISSNAAAGGEGGGLYTHASVDGLTWAFVDNSTFSGNSATVNGIFGGSGGAIFNSASFGGQIILVLEDCTLNGNHAPSAGGIYNSNLSGEAKVALSNTILKRGALGENFINSNGTIESQGYNLADDAAGGLSGSGPGGYLNQPTDKRETDPLLGPLQNNGGRTHTHALLAGSPAIDAGPSSAGDYDQRGFKRDAMHDIGAFEANGVPLEVELTSIVSRKTHGSAGDFDLNVALSGPLSIESRSGGANGNHKLVFALTNPLVSVGGATVTAGVGSVSASGISADARQFTVDLTGVANAQIITVTLTDVRDSLGWLSPTISVPVALLAGDSNADFVVNSGDAQQTRTRSGQATNAPNFRSDYNADGVINSGDAAIVRSRSGSSIEK